ncbi:MAG: PD40 domain-containing protein [Armatimonadetes bacterium]|nr:PD40 domain-containing protein [Armatimonadota bacterium]
MNWGKVSFFGLLAVASTVGHAEQLKLLRQPAINGSQVVFVYAGDLWTYELGSSEYARRLTSGAGIVSNPRFSRDGKLLAFTAAYDGAQNVYVIPAEGGEPRRLTFDPEPDVAIGWTPDGKIAYRSAHGSFTNRQARLWLVDPNVGGSETTPILEFSEGSFSPDGNKVAYTRQYADRFNWRRYRGGSQGVISIYDLKNNAYRELPHARENSWRPMWVGDDIYFLCDKSLGTVNLFRFSASSGKTQELTHFSDHDMKWAQTDGRSIIFERNGGLYTYSLANGVVNPVEPKVASDEVATRPYFRKLGNELESVSISPSGARVVGTARGILFSIPAKDGDTRTLYSHPGARARQAQWAPDGKQIAFLSDESGSQQLYTMPREGGVATKISDHNDAPIVKYWWSPDGKSLLLSDALGQLNLVDLATKTEINILTAPWGIDSASFTADGKWLAVSHLADPIRAEISLYEVATRKLTKVSEGYFSDTGVSIDRNGKYLYFVSARTVNPGASTDVQITQESLQSRIYMIPLAKVSSNPLAPPQDDEAPSSKAASEPATVDLNGIQQRITPLPLPPGNYGPTTAGVNGVFYAANGSLNKFDIASRQATAIMPMAPGIDINAACTKVAYFATGRQLCVADIHPGVQPGEGKVDTSAVAATIDPRAEWKQMFWEVWRYERDHFYDKDMLGMDWKAIGENYAAMLPQVRSRSDLSYLLGLLVSELGTSHAYVDGGEIFPVPKPVPVGQLGADIEWVGDHAKFKKIYRGFSYDEARRGPLGELGVDVTEGEYLLAVDGEEVTRQRPAEALLLGKVGRIVTLTVGKSPSLEGSHKVVVKPISSEVDLRYADWIEMNRRIVDQMSGGRIGYMHVPDTLNDGIVEFTKAFYAQTGKDAIIVDERFNGGGYIPTFFIEKLLRQSISGAMVRNSGPRLTPAYQISGPKVMLINAYAGSGGDMFPWLFKEWKLGPLMGSRTFGGLIGFTGIDLLLDGGTVTSPAIGLFDHRNGQWIAENKGIEPDFDVDARPDLVANGRDPQLEEAVKYLMDQLKKLGPPKIILPRFPRVGK